MTKDLISIIVPVYNVEEYLQRCIDSLLNQTYPNLEIILIDDGSTDASLEICKKAAKEDSRIKVLTQRNSGSSIARNLGLDNVTGEYTYFVDSDDYIDLETIDIMIHLMNNHDLDLVEFERDDPSGNTMFTNEFKIETKEEAIIRTIQTSGFQVWKRLYRTSLISDMRFIPKIIHQDVFYIIDLLNKVEQIGHLNKPLYIYNRENLSVIRSKYTLNKTQAGINATEYIIEKAADTPNIVECKKRYVVNYYTGHFFSLCRNKNLDKNKSYRRQLRNKIRRNANFKNVGPRSIIVILMPTIVVELLVKLHMTITGTKYYQ